MKRTRDLALALMIATVALWSISPSHGQQGTPATGEWRVYGGDSGNTRYSPLDQINGQNVKSLEVVWRWKAQNMGPVPEFRWEVTPLMIGRTLYFTAGAGRTVVAADAATGETLWIYRGDDTAERGVTWTSNRGLAHWSDGRSDDRVVFVTPGYQLVALNAKTGLPIPTFGRDSHVDLRIGLDRSVIPNGSIGTTSPPIIVRDVVVVGAGLPGSMLGPLPKRENVPGYIRGYDVRSGKLLWTFHTVPQGGEFGVETWGKDDRGIDSWKFTGHTGAWAPLSADEELGYVYIPVEAPSGDTYGGQRPGANLFSDSVVCLDARTGTRVWHYQLIHHDLWDYDIPAAPLLADIRVDGRDIKALAQVTKTAFTFVFDRTNGRPIWPIEERPVPRGNVPGEWYSPTQPFPTKPLPFDRQGVREADLADYTPEIKAEALKLASRYVLGPIFTPPIVWTPGGGKERTLSLPATDGGANWHGASFDPETRILYVPSITRPELMSLVPGADQSEMPYIVGGGGDGRINVANGLPLIKGPYGRITAINLNTGDHAWMIPNGRPGPNIMNNAALKAAGIDPSSWGGLQRSPILVTKTLLVEGSDDLRFIDKATGSVIHEMPLGGVVGPTMTYLINGRQFLVAVVLGQQPLVPVVNGQFRPGTGAELVALALPQSGRGLPAVVPVGRPQ